MYAGTQRKVAQGAGKWAEALEGVAKVQESGEAQESGRAEHRKVQNLR